MTPAERPTSIKQENIKLVAALTADLPIDQRDVARMAAAGLVALKNNASIRVTERGLRELAAVAWFTDLPGDERTT